MHFLSPVQRMPLLEVIRGRSTGRRRWRRRSPWGRDRQTGSWSTMVPASTPRGILAPYVNEAAFLFNEGPRSEDIDRALVEFGFPVGPISSSTRWGRRRIEIAHIMHERSAPGWAPPPGFEKLVESGRLDGSPKKGFYLYGTRGARKWTAPSTT